MLHTSFGEKKDGEEKLMEEKASRHTHTHTVRWIIGICNNISFGTVTGRTDLGNWTELYHIQRPTSDTFS